MDISLLISIFLISLASIALLIKLTKRVGLIDIPNKRSIHKNPIPRGAGIAFILAVFVVLVLFDFEHIKNYYYKNMQKKSLLRSCF